MPDQERQPSSIRKIATSGGYGRDREKYALNDPVLRANEKREVEDGPDEEESTDIDFLADVVFGGIAPFAEDPCGKEQQGERLLGLVPQQHPAGNAAMAHMQNRGRPVLLDIEDLADQRDGRAGGDGAHGVQRRGEAS